MSGSCQSTLSYEFDQSGQELRGSEFPDPAEAVSVCPLPEQNVSKPSSFSASKIDLTMSNFDVITSTQKDQSFGSTVPVSSQNSSLRSPIDPVESSQTSSRLANNNNIYSSPIDQFSADTWKKLREMKQIVAKFLSVSNRKEMLETIGDVKQIVTLFSWFVHFVESVNKLESSCSGDISSVIESSQESHPKRKVLKKTASYKSPNFKSPLTDDSCASLPPIAEETFYRSETSGGESLDSGNLVYAPWADRYYYPAEIHQTASQPVSKKNQLCTVLFHEPPQPTEAEVESPMDERHQRELTIREVHYQRIFNQEKLPVYAVVHAQRDQNDPTLFEKGKITQLIQSAKFDKEMAKLAKHNYAYMVQFDDTEECLPMRRDQVIIDHASLKQVLVQSQKERQSSTSPKINRLFKSMSLDERKEQNAQSNLNALLYRTEKSPISRLAKEEDARTTCSLGTPKASRTAKLKRHLTEQTLSESTEAMLSAKKCQKLFSGYFFMLTGYQRSGEEPLSPQEQPLIDFTSRTTTSSPERGRQSMLMFEDEDVEEDPSGWLGDVEPCNICSEEQLNQLIVENGGKLVRNVEDLDRKLIGRTFLLAPTYIPTTRFLACLALNIPCVSGIRFIEDSLAAKSLKKPDFYRLSSGIDPKTGDPIEFSKREDKTERLFEGRTFFLPALMLSSPLAMVLKLAGAEVAHRERFTRSQMDVGQNFAISSETCFFSQDVKSAFEENSVPVLSVQYIVQCLAANKELEFFEYLID